MKKNILLLACLCVNITAHAMTWSWAYAPSAYEAEITASMNGCIGTWNTYADYDFNIPVAYNAGVPTAQASYQGWIEFGGQRNYRTAMHESSHWMGTGTIWEWRSDNHFRWGVWNGTYAFNLRCAFDGPGERQFGDYNDPHVHYWPDGANYDSEGVNGPHMVGIIGAFRRDTGLDDQTIGIASGTYRICHRWSTLTLDSLGETSEGAQVRQNHTLTGDNDQLWDVSLVEGTVYFTIQNVANGLCLDSLDGADGDPVGMTSLSGAPTDTQLWEIVQTDSFYFKIINKANGRGLDNFGYLDAGVGVNQYGAAGNESWNLHWTFKHQHAQTMPEQGVVSQGRPVSSSSWDGANGHYSEKGNNGVAEDRWTASGGAYPQWWHVDLGVVQPISKVEVDWFPGGVFQFQIEVSDDNSTWTTVADRTSNTASGTTVDYLTGVSGRFVRVTVTGAWYGGWAAFMECRVYNESENLKLLSLNRPCSASSEQLGNLAVNANNVDPIFTRWCSATSAYPAWWEVDLGSPQQVNKAVITWFDDDARSYQYKIEGSLDGNNWFLLADRTGNTDAYTTFDTFSSVAQKVRITVTGGSHGWPSIYDAQIYGDGSPPSFTTDPISNDAGIESVDYQGQSLAGYADYIDGVETLTFSKDAGPNWLAVSPDGTLSGRPGDRNIGANIFTVRVTDDGGLTDTAQMTIQVANTYSGVRGLEDLAGLAAQWLMTGCMDTPACDGADLSSDQDVDMDDFERMSANWLADETLQLHLKLDETSGAIAKDSSVYTRLGNLVNGPVWTSGYVGGALSFDGVDDYVEVTNYKGIPGGQSRTCMAWVKTSSISGEILTWGEDYNGGRWVIRVNEGGQLRAEVQGGNIIGTTLISDDTWHHITVAVVDDGSSDIAEVQLYVDGQLETISAFADEPIDTGSVEDVNIGVYFAAGNPRWFNGLIDDVRIYDEALTEQEIQAIGGQ